MPHRFSPSRLIAACGLLGAGLIVAFPVLPANENGALALSLAGISLWATGAIPEYVTAIAFFTFAMLFKTAAPEVIFTGFQSTALWLIFGGLVIGVAVRSTGLGQRLARRLAQSFGNSYWGVIGGVTMVGVAMGFLMPSSMGRAILLMPIALSLADGFGFAPGSKGRTGVVLAAAFGCHTGTFSILPANVPNVVFLGAAESAYHYTATYGSYLLLHFPVMGVLKSALLVPLIVWLCPDRPQPVAAPHLPAMSREERHLSILLAVALLLWATDALHHISPAWISMAAALILLLPGIGLVGQKQFGTEVNFGSMFYVGGIMGLGALVDKSGLGHRLAELFLKVLPLSPGAAVTNFASLSAIATLTGMLTTLPGVPAVLTPLAGQMAQASGLPLPSVLMSQVLGFSNPVLPYESAPLVVAMQLGGEPVRPALILCLLLAAVTIVFLLPLDFLWWRLLGWI